MFEVEKTSKRFEFPAIDLKFQNTGHATAILWAFEIEVMEAEVDPTPVISARYLGPGVEKTDWNSAYWAELFDSSRGLKVLVINNGWGPAKDCRLIIENNLLGELYTDDERCFLGQIESKEEKLLLELEPRQLDEKDLNRFKASDVAPDCDDSCRSVWLGDRIAEDILVNDILLRGTVRDAHGNQKEVHEAVKPPTDYGRLVLKKDRFLWREGTSPMYGPLRSFAIYPAIIDPEKGSHVRSYRISRKIPPGDVERFHIMVGATKSCKIKVKFRFRIDKDQTVETGIFDIAIWNPVNEEYHRKYPDGQEMVERFVELGEKAARSKLDYSHGENYELQKLRDNLRLIMDSPFMNEEPKEYSW